MSERPNILLIMTDQQRHDQLGAWSNGQFETPAIDDLARCGVVFENAYSSSTTCVPARVSLLTGVHHHRAALGRRLALRPGTWTLARELSAAGYQTIYVGKMHAHPIRARHGFESVSLCEHLLPRAGYDDTDIDDYRTWLLWQGRADHRTTHLFGPGLEDEARAYGERLQTDPFPLPDEYHPTGWVARKTVAALDARDRTRRYFCVVSFPHPHAPYDPPASYASKYPPVETPLPAVPELDAFPPRFRDLDFASDARFRPTTVSRAGALAAKTVLARIRALVNQIDDAVGRILKAVDLTETLVFFTSDHGDYSGHRGLLGKIPWIPFDDLAKVPLIAAGPGIPPGARITTPVQNFDFVATSLRRAGCPVPADLDALDLCAHLHDAPPSAEKRPVFSAASMGFPMVRCGSLKYILHPPSGEEVLFDLGVDPSETKNLAQEPDHRAETDRLRRLAVEYAGARKADLPA